MQCGVSTPCVSLRWAPPCIPPQRGGRVSGCSAKRGGTRSPPLFRYAKKGELKGVHTVFRKFRISVRLKSPSALPRRIRRISPDVVRGGVVPRCRGLWGCRGVGWWGWGWGGLRGSRCGRRRRGLIGCLGRRRFSTPDVPRRMLEDRLASVPSSRTETMVTFGYVGFEA